MVACSSAPQNTVVYVNHGRCDVLRFSDPSLVVGMRDITFTRCDLSGRDRVDPNRKQDLPVVLAVRIGVGVDADRLSSVLESGCATQSAPLIRTGNRSNSCVRVLRPGRPSCSSLLLAQPRPKAGCAELVLGGPI